MRDIHWKLLEDEERRMPRAVEGVLLGDEKPQAFDFALLADAKPIFGAGMNLLAASTHGRAGPAIHSLSASHAELDLVAIGQDDGSLAAWATGPDVEAAGRPCSMDPHNWSEGRALGSEGRAAEAGGAAAASAAAAAGSERTTFDGIPLSQILQERPDVFRAFFTEYYGPGNDRNSDAWLKRVGGATPEDYANYWYEKHGRWEGYGQGKPGAAEPIDVERLLLDRPDVFRAFYEEFYGPNNDRKSPAWVQRVGGETVQDYAKYWYVTYGQKEGYTQRPPASIEPPASGESPPLGEPPLGEPPPSVHDPADDPWNHPALFPEWQPPYDGWEPPPNIWHPGFDADPLI